MLTGGLLFELETERNPDVSEFATTLLVEKELGSFGATLNLTLGYEWGDAVTNELETELAGQLVYRYSRPFEPAIELYLGQASKGIGPVGLGEFRMGPGRKLLWELGAIFGLDSSSPDIIFRGMLEYEF